MGRDGRPWLKADPNFKLKKYVGPQQQLSIDICCRRPTSAANPPVAAAAVDRWDRQTDKWTDRHSVVL